MKKQRIPLIFIALVAAICQQAIAADNTQCPDFLKQEFKLLHSSKSLNLCSLHNDKPMLIVNTASHCGFTKQFKTLEALYKKYKDQGLQVVGFASNDFNQEAKTEEEAADICYKNFGVTFTMFAPTKVKGEDANPVFSYLAKRSGQQPNWNFNKYLVADSGESIRHFEKEAQPLGGEIEALIVDGL